MFHVRNENLSATLEAFFPRPVPFDAATSKVIARNALEKFAKYGLRPNQIHQRSGDQLFDYDLSFFLFNYQAHFRFGAERLFVNVQNARGRQDVEILVEAMILAAQCLEAGAVERFNFQAGSHAVFDVETERVKFFEAFVDLANHVTGGGKIITVQQTEWKTPVRLAVEKSVVVKDGAFLAWATDQIGSVDLESLKMIADRFGVSAKSLGLEYRFE